MDSEQNNQVEAFYTVALGAARLWRPWPAATLTAAVARATHHSDYTATAAVGRPVFTIVCSFSWPTELLDDIEHPVPLLDDAWMDSSMLLRPNQVSDTGAEGWVSARRPFL